MPMQQLQCCLEHEKLPSCRTGILTSRSGKSSFSSLIARCTKPSGLNASSAVEVFKCSGVCTQHILASDFLTPPIVLQGARRF